MKTKTQMCCWISSPLFQALKEAKRRTGKPLNRLVEEAIAEKLRRTRKSK
jgi:hypothetical protein